MTVTIWAVFDDFAHSSSSWQYWIYKHTTPHHITSYEKRNEFNTGNKHLHGSIYMLHDKDPSTSNQAFKSWLAARNFLSLKQLLYGHSIDKSMYTTHQSAGWYEFLMLWKIFWNARLPLAALQLYHKVNIHMHECCRSWRNKNLLAHILGAWCSYSYAILPLPLRYLFIDKQQIKPPFKIIYSFSSALVMFVAALLLFNWLYFRFEVGRLL